MQIVHVRPLIENGCAQHPIQVPNEDDARFLSFLLGVVSDKQIKDAYVFARKEHPEYHTDSYSDPTKGICTCGAQDRAEHRPHSDECGVYKT